MVTLLFLCRRRPDLTRVAYGGHLRDVHVPLALRHHRALLAYRVHLVAAAPPPDDVDSVNVLVFPSLADFLERPYASPEGAAAVTEDHARFLAGADGYVADTVDDAAVPPHASRPATWIVALRGGGAPPAPSAWRAALPTLTRTTTHRVDRRLYETGRAWECLVELQAALATPGDAAAATATLDAARARLAPESTRWTVEEHVARALG